MMVLIGLLALFAHEGLEHGGGHSGGGALRLHQLSGADDQPLIEMTNQLNQLQQAMVAGSGYSPCSMKPARAPTGRCAPGGTGTLRRGGLLHDGGSRCCKM